MSPQAAGRPKAIAVRGQPDTRSKARRRGRFVAEPHRDSRPPIAGSGGNWPYPPVRAPRSWGGPTKAPSIGVADTNF